MRRMLRPLLALAALLLPAPALADVTARYAAGASRITVEAADSGDWRFEISGKLELIVIHKGGEDFFAIRDSQDRLRVTRAPAALTALLGPPPAGDHPMVFEALRGAPDTLAGYSGARWTFGPHGEAPMSLLMSPDPRLAPIGTVFRGLAELIIGASGEQLGPAQLRLLFASGTPLRIGSPTDAKGPVFMVALESVSMAAIDRSRFDLPGEVLTGEAFSAFVPRLFPEPQPVSVVD